MGVAIIALVIACVIGWHASKAHMSHGGIPVRKGQLGGFRKERAHHVIRMLLFAVITVVVLLVAIH
ncbi:MAG TPA: hypothetical protein VMC83_36730 [Streptosporangiaceae bacterium]|nr:hypothetical protein [Streptosporangiaceae bacterium]